MQNIPSSWRDFLQNLFLYLLLLGGVMTVLLFYKWAWLVALMWIIAVGGGMLLAVQAVQLIGGANQADASAQARLNLYLEQTRDYRRQISQLSKNAADSARLQHLQSQVEMWTASIENLIDRVTYLRNDPLLQQDLQRVPKAIVELEGKIAAETDPSICEQLAGTLKNRQKQMESLDGLQRTIKRAEIQIESALSMLGTIYSQLLTSQSTSHVADYSRLSADVDDEVNRLQDHLEALREVKLAGK